MIDELGIDQDGGRRFTPGTCRTPVPVGASSGDIFNANGADNGGACFDDGM